MSEKKNGRDFWSSKYGLILAMAGNAVGLGNFLRFIDSIWYFYGILFFC